MEIECRWVTPEDAPRIHALHEVTTPQEGGRPQEQWLARWRWAHLDNPAHQQDVPVGVVAERGGELVGHLGLTPVALSLGPRGLIGQASEGFLVHPSCQGQGIGRRLAEPVWGSDAIPTPVTFTATDTSAHLFEKYAAIRAPLALSQTRLRVLSPDALLQRLGAKPDRVGRMLATPGIRQAAGLALRLVIAAASARAARPGSGWRTATASSSAEADAELDALSQAARLPGVLACRVDAAYLAWRYRAAPAPAGVRHALLEVRNAGELRGVAAIEERPHPDWGGSFATLMDLVSRPEDEARVLSCLLAHGRAEGWVALRAPFRSPSFDATCARSGFVKEAESRTHTMLKARGELAGAEAWARDPARYVLGMGCRW